MGKHYVDNKVLYQTLLDYKHLRLKAEEKGLKKKDKGYPPIPNYVGECLLQITGYLISLIFLTICLEKRW